MRKICTCHSQVVSKSFTLKKKRMFFNHSDRVKDSVAESIHYVLNHNSFQMSCELTHFTSNSEFEFKELLRENDGINVNSTQK